MAKRKTTTPARTVQYLHLQTSSYTDVTRESDPEDRWSSDDTSTSWTVDSITLSDKDGHHALPADFPVQVGDTVHVVYSTGDSFHQAAGAYLEVISFHKDAEVASRNKAMINARTRGGRYKMMIECKGDQWSPF